MNSRRTDRKAALTPETCGAAILVPLSSLYSAITFVNCAAPALGDSALARVSAFVACAGAIGGLPGVAGSAAGACGGSFDALHERIFSPGATRSGFRRPSPVG